MTDANKRAMFKTALTVGVIAIVLAIASVWPPILGWVAMLFFVGMFIGAIFAVFSMYEDHKDTKWK